MSQYEVGVSVARHVIFDYLANNRLPKPMGNRHPCACPHGRYRCKGDDRRCVIAVFDEKEWETFCSLIGKPELATSHKFATFAARKRNEDELDEIIEAWTVN
jgi:crotonobetainyl-CoA:carnitine CoA-transferase CaiB-like acyl-CoA transferase